jgi:hypothetical protein
MEPIIKPIKINSPDGGSETVDAEQVDNDVFKLIENPIMHCRINYGTLVKAHTDANGDLVLSKIVRASNFKTRQFFLSASLTETELRTKIGQPVLDAGGMWEVVFGGICFVHIPKDSGFDLDELLMIQNNSTVLSVRISCRRQSSCAAGTAVYQFSRIPY